MTRIRVPYPAEPERRRAVFERAAKLVGRHGSVAGTPDAGAFRGTTPVGPFAGEYHSPEGSDVLVIELTKKPRLVPARLVEAEVRRFLTTM